jgi:hypothetical protein
LTKILTHLPAPRCLHSRKDGSSLEGQRSIADFFHMLDKLIKVDNADDYKLQKFNDEHPVELERLSPGNIVAGDYLISKSP